MNNVLRIDASARHEGSVSRRIADHVVAGLGSSARISVRDLAVDPAPFVNADWVGATFTPLAARSSAQHEVLSGSDQLVEELEAADIVVIATPIYNFGVPAALKAWFDQVARAGRTFRYTEAGPEGLLKGKRAVIAIASGGTPIGSEIDFATPWLRHMLGFLGITDVDIVSRDSLPEREAA